MQIFNPDTSMLKCAQHTLLMGSTPGVPSELVSTNISSDLLMEHVIVRNINATAPPTRYINLSSAVASMWDATGNFQIGKFFPEKVGISLPVYMSYNQIRKDQKKKTNDETHHFPLQVGFEDWMKIFISSASP